MSGLSDRTDDLGRSFGPWTKGTPYTCQRCGKACVTYQRRPAKWCGPCKRIVSNELWVERDRARRAVRRAETA